MNELTKNKIISSALQTADGRKKLAQAMIQPLRRKRVDCPVCNESVYDLREHAISKTDDEHKVLVVLET
jgi:hypothetical protein